MSARRDIPPPEAIISRGYRWSLIGSLSALLCARARAYRVIEAAIYDAESVPFVSWPGSGGTEGVPSHCYFCVSRYEELSKRAQQLIMFIARKRAARSATSLDFLQIATLLFGNWEIFLLLLPLLIVFLIFIFFPQHELLNCFFNSFSEEIRLTLLNNFSIFDDFTWLITIYFWKMCDPLWYLYFGNHVYLSSSLSMISSVGFIFNRFLIVRRSEFSLQRTLNWSRYRSLSLIAESDHLKYTGCLWEIQSNSKNVFYWFPRSTQIQASCTCPYLQSVTTVWNSTFTCQTNRSNSWETTMYPSSLYAL